MKPFIVSMIVATTISILFLAIIFWIFFQYSGSASSGKDTLNTLGSYFGGITTLGAAIVAGYLFNDWRDNENFKRTQYLYDNCLQVAYDSTEHIDVLLHLLLQPKNSVNNQKISETISTLLDSTFVLISKVGMDYNESIKSDKKLEELFEIVLIINKKFRDYDNNTLTLSYATLDVFCDDINRRLDEISRSCIGKYEAYFN